MEVPLVGFDGGLQGVIENVVVAQVVGDDVVVVFVVAMNDAIVVQVAKVLKILLVVVESGDVLALMASLHVVDKLKGVLFAWFGLDICD